MSTATISPDRILKELAALWIEEGKQGTAGVLRACSMTLIVIGDEGEDAGEIGETIAALMPEHPARTILIKLRASQERALSSRVYQQCWKPFGQRRQICCEQIELTASDAALGDLPSVLLPLIVADLPVILWCRSARLAGLPEFRQIAGMAGKVVVDSAALGKSANAFARLAEAQKSGLQIGDLAWTRLTRWRETFARLFENREYLAKLSGVREVRVTCGAGYETAAWYLAAWTENSLRDAGIQVTPVVRRDGEAIQVQLTGPELTAELRREEDRLVVKVGQLATCTHLPQDSDYLLMREELGIVRRDTIFDRALSSARQLALSSPTA